DGDGGHRGEGAAEPVDRAEADLSKRPVDDAEVAVVDQPPEQADDGWRHGDREDEQDASDRAEQAPARVVQEQGDADAKHDLDRDRQEEELEGSPQGAPEQSILQDRAVVVEADPGRAEVGLRELEELEAGADGVDKRIDADREEGQNGRCQHDQRGHVGTRAPGPSSPLPFQGGTTRDWCGGHASTPVSGRSGVGAGSKCSRKRSAARFRKDCPSEERWTVPPGRSPSSALAGGSPYRPAAGPRPPAPP